MPEDVRETLAVLPQVGDLPADTLDELARVGRRVRIAAGWTPIHAKEPADKAYVVLEGQLDVIRGGERVAALTAGALAGEMGLVDHRLRNARVTASGPVVVLAWPRSDFQELREAHPEFDALVVETTQARHQDDAG